MFSKQVDGAPYISVVIPTLNRESMLVNVVDYFLNKESFRDFELIVVDQSDSPSALLIEYANDLNRDVRLIYRHESFRQTTRAKNVGVSVASGQVVVFSEDDVEPWQDILQVYFDMFVDPAIIAATGPVLLSGQQIRMAEQVSESERKKLESQKSMCFDVAFPFNAVFGAGGNSAYRIGVFKKTGGFDLSFTGNAWGEELEFGFRVRKLCGNIHYNPEAGVVHLVAPTGGSRSAPALKYIRDFVRNSVYTSIRTEKSAPYHFLATWRAYRRLVLNKNVFTHRQLITGTMATIQGLFAGLLLGSRKITSSMEKDDT